MFCFPIIPKVVLPYFLSSFIHISDSILVSELLLVLEKSRHELQVAFSVCHHCASRHRGYLLGRAVMALTEHFPLVPSESQGMSITVDIFLFICTEISIKRPSTLSHVHPLCRQPRPQPRDPAPPPDSLLTGKGAALPAPGSRCRHLSCSTPLREAS